MKRYLCIISIVLLLCLLAGCDGLLGQPEEPEIIYYSNSDNEYEYVLENDTLTFKMTGETGYFTLTDKRSGRVWNSVPAGASSDSSAESAARNSMMSPVILTYSDSTGSRLTYDGYTYAVKDGTFQITQDGDTIRVDYMIGPSARFYIAPEAISEERMKDYQSRMEGTGKQTVVRSYRKLDINKIKDEKEKERLLELIPMLADTVVYALPVATGGNALPRYMMEDIEEAFIAAGYTEEDAHNDAMGNQDYSGVVQFNLSMIYRLSDDGLKVEIPADSIVWPVNNPLIEVKVHPYFLSAGNDDQGYLLVPDGGGGQIFFHNGKITQNNYYSNVYGWNESIIRQTRVQETDSMFPVFGIAKNDGYILAVSEGGAAELSVEADIAGKWSSYDYICPVFTVVHGQDTEVSEKSSSSIMVYQEIDHVEDFSLTYFTGNSGSYVDMAMRYRTYLQDTFGSLNKTEEDGYALLVELIGAIDRSEKVLGIPVRQTYGAVTYKEALAIVEALKDVTNLRVQYSAVLNGGMYQKALMNADVVTKLGSKADREALMAAVESMGAKLYVSAYTELVMDTSWFNYNAYAARETTNVAITLWPYRQDTQNQSEVKNETMYLLNLESIQKAATELAQEALQWNDAGIGFNDMGDVLYSDFRKKDGTSRDEMRRAQSEIMKNLKEQGKDVLVTGGNDYGAIFADIITDMDLAGNGYDLVDRQIPFYQIALHGYVTYSGEALNASGDYKTALLKVVETGAALNFTFMETEYREIQGNRYTYLTDLFSANFADWQTELTTVYQRLNSELGHTVNQTIVGHEWLNDFVAKTTYEDGTTVYVNYSEVVYNDGSVTVGAEDWLVVKGG